jgi:hypothetical protein
MLATLNGVRKDRDAKAELNRRSQDLWCPGRHRDFASRRMNR